MAIETKHRYILGAFLAVLIMLLCILIFVFRMCNYQNTEHWLGIILLFTFFPLSYLFREGKRLGESRIYLLQTGTMIVFLIAELILDYILVFPFREVKWMLIIYVMLFFAGTVGMIGVASKANKTWSILTIILFFNMLALAFMQHAKTGI